MPTPLPHQLVGAKFLADRNTALLADAPRVGKTGTSIIAADYVFARSILVITTSSARADWGYQFRAWQAYPRSVQVIYSAKDVIDPTANVTVVGWGMIFDPKLYPQLMARTYDLIIVDEGHNAKNKDSKRTKALYGRDVNGRDGLVSRASRNWVLTGTPIPNAPNDIYPMLKALAPGLIAHASSYDEFLKRYCIVRKKRVSPYTTIDVVMGGRNEAELATYLESFMLRRTQQDVGITAPIYSVFPVHVEHMPELDDADTKAVLEAIENGLERELDMQLGTIRRIVGSAKAAGVAEAVAERLEDGALDKVVLMCWHSDVIDALEDALSSYGVVVIDGRTLPTKRHARQQEFQTGSARVFIGQIIAAGEALDLSASAELWFVEASFTPKDMAQAAMRICNHTQKRQPLVRVCALEGSIDEAIMGVLTRKVASIKQILE
jgi:SWI/SNF-related matrix-associated actin-dependent regulator of chromatin subfamily A-like protein 1